MKNDLIERQAVIDAFWYLDVEIDPSAIAAILEMLKSVPSAQPELNFDEWCTDCKEYDHERHCCPRFNRVIRNALKDAQPEPQWIPVSERLPDDLGDYLVSIKRIGWNMEEYVENDIAYWDDLEGFHKADEVLAWMPLPEPYRAERRTDEQT